MPDIIAVVKAGTLPGYTNKPIGRAFDAAFPGGTWTAEETGMGEMFAHFKSTTTAETLEAADIPAIGREQCLDGAQHPCRVTVHFQFTLSSDNRTVGLIWAGAPDRVTGDARFRALIDFVYR
jgi:isoaspartyl peptidase/L-asparaginase-like protein (Ntn-hydrolase superfamily)